MYESGGPFGALLTGTCIGCHTGTDDPLHNTMNTPFVISSTSDFSDDLCLAGGFFPATMVAGNNNNDHHGVISTNIHAPAGFDSGGTFQNYSGGTNGLGCAGTNGCHGNQTDLSDMDAIKGGHHNTSSTYRMLYVGTDKVCGDPAVDYEELIIQTPGTTVSRDGTGQNVNIYSAGSTTTDATISELCGKCHGVFHGAGTTNAASEWIRHPSDVELPTDWTMTGTYDFDGDDAKNNPFGYTNAVYTGNNTQATCLSCHRAHGTANNDLLRWAYITQLAGQAAGSQIDYGCLGCHNAQR
jgi:predicted CXXCH cytochrome family protein